VSRQMGLPRNPRARRPKPKMGSLYFWWPSQGSCRAAMVEPTDFLLLLRVHGPCRSLRSSHLSWVCRPRSFYPSCVISSTTLCLLRYFLRTAIVMGRKRVTGDVLNTRAKTNGYKGGAPREEDSRQVCNKHKDDTKKDQDKALDGYVL
jgi:hypothetical protein